MMFCLFFANENGFTVFMQSLHILYHSSFLTIIYHAHYVLLINEALTQFLKTAGLFHGIYLTLSLWVDI